jgi:monoamine oxidase
MTASDSNHTRRDLLTASVAAVAGIVLQKDVLAMNELDQENRRVAVVGAGFGGLACAYELSAAGYFVDLFEARNRIGGRVHTAQEFAPNQHVEFGAELIGKNHPHWQRYAKQFGIELVSVEDEEPGPSKTILIDGKRYSGNEAVALEKELDEGRAELTRDAATVNSEEPRKSANAERLDRMSTAERLKTLKISDQARRAFQVELEHDMAVSLDKMNYLALLCTIQGHGGGLFWSDTEAFRTKAGNQILASHLAGGIRDGGLYLDCPIVEIHAEAAGVEVVLPDGRKLKYDDVVLAVPPSVWDRIKITPALPKQLNPQMGIATKFLSVCSSDFWTPRQSADSLTDTLIGSTWEGPPADSGKHRSLVGFAGGPYAEKIREIPFEKQEAQLRDSFEKLIPGYHASYLKSEFVDWPGQPWTRGGYSFPAPGEFLTQSRIFRDGIGHLHFAGEHASCGFIGYMEGGLESGVSLAKRLIKRDQARA